jgi:predicted HicB family RNase H-like nuclease
MKTRHPHAMTLRLDPRLHDLVTDASYDARLSKAAYIRRAIHASLGQRRRGEPAMQEPALR